MKQYGFGVDLCGTACKIGLFKTSCELLDKREIKTNKENNGAYQSITRFVTAILIHRIS